MPALHQTDHKQRLLPTHNDRFPEWKRLCGAILREENDDGSNHDHMNVQQHMDATVPVIDLLPTKAPPRIRIYQYDWEDTAWTLKLSIDKMAQLLQREITKQQQELLASSDASS